MIHKVGCNLHVFGATQLVCSSVTLARYVYIMLFIYIYLKLLNDYTVRYQLVLRTAVSIRGSLFT